LTWLHKALLRFTVKDLLLIAAMAALGIAVKTVISPLIHLLSAPLFIPGGTLAGGLYMMWLLVAMGLTGKRGAATLVGLIQAILVTLTGVSSSHGLLSLISYTLPGLAVDLGLWLLRHRLCCLPCAFIAGILANTSGTLAVNMIVFRLPLIPLLLSVLTAAFSGGAGAVLAWHLLQALRRFHITAAEER
jgi:type III secretory pathway component EscS